MYYGIHQMYLQKIENRGNKMEENDVFKTIEQPITQERFNKLYRAIF